MAVVLGLFVFWCIYKVITYFKKMKEAKVREKKYQDHLDYVLSMQGSQVSGEGVKDMQLGMLFKKNPAYKAASSASHDLHK